MGNYKPFSGKAISTAAVYYPLKAGEVIVTLSSGAPPTTTGKTLHTGANADYQVPTGKIFKTISVGFMGNASATRYLTVEYSDAADASTNGVEICRFAPPSKSDLFWAAADQSVLAPADKYINLKTDNVTNTGQCAQLIGVEYTA